MIEKVVHKSFKLEIESVDLALNILKIIDVVETFILLLANRKVFQHNRDVLHFSSTINIAVLFEIDFCQQSNHLGCFYLHFFFRLSHLYYIEGDFIIVGKLKHLCYGNHQER